MSPRPLDLWYLRCIFLHLWNHILCQWSWKRWNSQVEISLTCFNSHAYRNGRPFGNWYTQSSWLNFPWVQRISSSYTSSYTSILLPSGQYDGATRGQHKMRGTRFNFMFVHSHWSFLIHLQPEVRRINWQQKTWSIWATIDLFSPWLILKIKAMAMWCESKRLIILRKLFSTLQHPSRVSSLYFVQFAHIHSSFIRYFKLLWNQITVSLSWSKRRL